jgi:hypothetical protein
VVVAAIVIVVMVVVFAVVVVVVAVTLIERVCVSFVREYARAGRGRGKSRSRGTGSSGGKYWLMSARGRCCLGCMLDHVVRPGCGTVAAVAVAVVVIAADVAAVAVAVAIIAVGATAAVVITVSGSVGTTTPTTPSLPTPSTCQYRRQGRPVTHPRRRWCWGLHLPVQRGVHAEQRLEVAEGRHLSLHPSCTSLCARP